MTAPLSGTSILRSMQDFRELRVWRKAVSLAINVRRAVSRCPARGYRDLKDQTIRAAESIHHNIVESCGAPTQKDMARFLGNSIKSSLELEGALQLAFAYEILPARDWDHLGEQTADTRKMLYGLRTKVLYGPRRDPVRGLSESISDSPTDNESRETHTDSVSELDASEPPPQPPEAPDA
jgi:four helix bundle protein